MGTAGHPDDGRAHGLPRRRDVALDRPWQRGRGAVQRRYLEIVPFERIVHTEMFDVEPFNQGEPALVTVTLETVEGGTKLTSRSRFPSVEALEGALATGMTGGAIESWDRLAEEIASI